MRFIHSFTITIDLHQAVVDDVTGPLLLQQVHSIVGEYYESPLRLHGGP